MPYFYEKQVIQTKTFYSNIRTVFFFPPSLTRNLWGKYIIHLRHKSNIKKYLHFCNVGEGKRGGQGMFKRVWP